MVELYQRVQNNNNKRSTTTSVINHIIAITWKSNIEWTLHPLGIQLTDPTVEFHPNGGVEFIETLGRILSGIRMDGAMTSLLLDRRPDMGKVAGCYAL
jgi:hypothetical protein